MLTDSTTGKTGINNTTAEIPDTLKAKTGAANHEAASINNDSQESSLKAQRNNLGAKGAALGAVTRFYQESENAEKKAEQMVSELEEVIQLALNATRKSCGIIEKDARRDNSSPASQHKQAELTSLNSSAGIANESQAAHSIRGTPDDQVKAEFYRLLMTKNPRLRHFVDDLTEQKARIKIDKIASEAKSEIIAARVAVNKAQEEINASKEETKKALIDTEATQQAAELIVSQVKQDALSQSATEIARAHAEVKAIQEVANSAVRRAEEEVKKSRDEVVTLSDYVKETLALAQEKVRKSAEELKTCKFQAQAAIMQAQEETQKARAEAELHRREAKTSLSKAAMETQQAKADMELARRTIQEATVVAEKQAYEKMTQEMKQMREDVDSTNKKAHEIISKAQAESQRAKEELETSKKNSDRALSESRKETQEVKAEAEKAKQAMHEAISQAEKESRRVKEEAEKSIIKANEAIMQAKKDVINLTRGEIARARQELESPVKAKEAVMELESVKPTAKNPNSDHLASVLHEMRNPLHSISGFAKIMLEEGVTDDKTRKEFLTIMVQQSASLNKLIDDMSNSLNDKGETFTVSEATVSPHDVISEAVDSVQQLAQQKKNLISYDVAASLPEIKADGFRIKQVIINLLTNAIKFSPESSPVYIKAGVVDKELIVQVIDSGTGISPADMPSIFDRGFRGANGDNAEGAGLGLNICREIIESHGGRIWAESVGGEGSKFSFSLPLAAT
jgi:nitrogen-specific signal transduction histidine kinase